MEKTNLWMILDVNEKDVPLDKELEFNGNEKEFRSFYCRTSISNNKEKSLFSLSRTIIIPKIVLN